MQIKTRFNNTVFYASLFQSFFAIPHLIDDFLFDIPDEFGLTNQIAQALAGVFTVVLVLVISLATRNRKAGYYGTLTMGIFLFLAGVLKHIPLMIQPGPYWSGWFSEFLIYGLIASSAFLAIASIAAIRSHTH
jgi:hypothetical protein